jgi:hypothetical protein
MNFELWAFSNRAGGLFLFIIIITELIQRICGLCCEQDFSLCNMEAVHSRLDKF